MKNTKLLCTTAIPLLGSDNPNGNANSANNIPNPIDTIIKSINHATNLSVQLDKITSTGRLFPDPVLDLEGEQLFDDSTYNKDSLGMYVILLLFPDWPSRNVPLTRAY